MRVIVVLKRTTITLLRFQIITKEERIMYAGRWINAENYETYIEISANGKKLILIDGQNAENLFEKVKDYDIIILYGKNAFSIKERIESENPDAKVFVSADGGIYSFYFEWQEETYGIDLWSRA